MVKLKNFMKDISQKNVILGFPQNNGMLHLYGLVYFLEMDLKL